MPEKVEEDLKGTPKAVSQTFSILCSILGLIITVLLGYYAYKNPDPKSCWVVQDLHASALSKEAIVKKAEDMGIEVTPGFPLEMGKLYRTWFAWGFWANMSITALSAIFYLV